MTHIPVMLEEVLGALAPKADETIVDGTFGGGGYSLAILDAAECHLYAIDRDLDAIVRAEALAMKQPRLHPLLGRFGNLAHVLKDAGVETVDGIVLDIGVSSFQLDEDARGFSFMRDGPLDMRMGQSGATAADIVNTWPEADVVRLIQSLGEASQADSSRHRATPREPSVCNNARSCGNNRGSGWRPERSTYTSGDEDVSSASYDGE